MAFTKVKLEVAAMFLLLLHTGVTDAMQVTSTGPQTIQKGIGEMVTLGCTYTPSSGDTGDLDIEWSNVSPDMTQKDSLILSYTGGSTHYYGTWGLKDRFKFTTDPKNGDASVSITNLGSKDTATYQCKVKKAPGIDTRKVTLVVMVPPSRPKCWVEGKEEKGSDVSLRCKSSEGSTPLTYSWTRDSGGPMPPVATQDSSTGVLLIKNHTDSYVGTYTCVVKNAVSTEQCQYALHAYNPTNRVGMIVGAVIGSILLLLLLLLLIWLICCCCNKRRYEKEQANDIREDAPAPESRPTSRASSLRSVMSYRTHHGVQYSSASGPLSSASEAGPNYVYTAGSVRASQRSNGNHKLTQSLKYDPQYGYAV
uniref:V-set and immunoglobulin domain containing 8b n=1 Tax=Neogobius melanostomus TaxID=47308 RepID=A0A8C6UMU8_9GOBI